MTSQTGPPPAPAPRSPAARESASVNGGAHGTADLRREQMLRAAIQIISERGYSETRIADVAERTGTSPALVIYYFRTKDQLLTEAIRFSEDEWYTAGERRMAGLSSAAARLQEMVAMNCLPEADPQPSLSWVLWLDLWAQAARNPELASVRQKADERWRELIKSIVVAGQGAGEFGGMDAADFAVCLAAMLDGLAVQMGLEDREVDRSRAYRLCMHFAAKSLEFDWTPGQGSSNGGTGQVSD